MRSICKKKSKWPWTIPQTISGSIAISSGIASLVTTFIAEHSLLHKFASYFVAIVVLSYAIVACIYLIYQIIHILKTGRKQISLFNEYIDTMKECAYRYGAFTRELKNDISQMILQDSTRKFNTQEFAKRCCNNIASYYEQLLGRKASVCIKTLLTKPLSSDSPDDWEIITYARSTSSYRERFNKDSVPVKISDNSDFYNIICNNSYNPASTNSLCFATVDLEKTVTDMAKKDHKYRNSTANYLDFYRSVMVVPINTECQYMNEKLAGVHKSPKATHHVIGFLCVDFEQPFTNDVEIANFMLGVQILFSFADMLYYFLEQHIVAQLDT